MLHRLALLAGLLIAAVSPPVVAEDVQVEIMVQEMPDGVPLQANVYRRDKTATAFAYLARVDGDGRLQIPEGDCSITTFYLATADSAEYSPESKNGERCKSGEPVLLKFHKKDYDAVIGPFYGLPLPAHWTSVPGNSVFVQTVTSVLTTNDYGTAAILAKAAADRLTAAGEFDLAKTYQEAATFWGVAAAVPKVTVAKPEGNYFAFDKPQNRFVLTFDGVDLMKQYQEANGIKDKDPLSWKTMRSLSDYMSAGGVSLGDFKAEALKPFSNNTFYVNNDSPSVFVPG